MSARFPLVWFLMLAPRILLGSSLDSNTIDVSPFIASAVEVALQDPGAESSRNSLKQIIATAPPAAKSEVEHLLFQYLDILNQKSLNGEQTFRARADFLRLTGWPSWTVALRKPEMLGLRPQRSVLACALNDTALLLPEMRSHQDHIATVRELKVRGEGARTVVGATRGLDLQGGLPAARLRTLLKTIEAPESRMHVALERIRDDSVYTNEQLAVIFPEAEFQEVIAKATEIIATAGTVVMVGGPSGSGKSSVLRTMNIDPRSALSPDPIKACDSSPSNPYCRRISNEQLHHEASSINKRVARSLQGDYHSSYVIDATLDDTTAVRNALSMGKKVVVIFTIVPPQQSLLRVLKRDPGAADPILPFDRVLEIYQGTLNSVQELVAIAKDHPRQMHLRIRGPRYNSSGKVESDSADWSHDDLPLRCREGCV